MPIRQIEALRADIASGRHHPMDAKADLAVEIITHYHGSSAAQAARGEFNRVFRKGEVPEDIETKHLKIAAPIRVSRLIASLQLASSVSEAQRLMEAGAVYIDEQRIADVKAELDLSQPSEHLLKVGKRRFLKLVITM
jgi:tyrosyl-tRNA synthetase